MLAGAPGAGARARGPSPGRQPAAWPCHTSEPRRQRRQAAPAGLQSSRPIQPPLLLLPPPCQAYNFLERKRSAAPADAAELRRLDGMARELLATGAMEDLVAAFSTLARWAGRWAGVDPRRCRGRPQAASRPACGRGTHAVFAHLLPTATACRPGRDAGWRRCAPPGQPPTRPKASGPRRTRRRPRCRPLTPSTCSSADTTATRTGGEPRPRLRLRLRSSHASSIPALPCSTLMLMPSGAGVPVSQLSPACLPCNPTP